MTTTTAADEIRRYGNLRRPLGAGLFGFGGMSTWLGFAGVGFAIILMMMARAAGLPGIPIALVVIVATMVAVVPTRRSRKTGLTGYDRGLAWLLNRTDRSKARGFQGPAGFSPDGTTRLPGFMAASQLHTFTTAFGEHLGAIEMRAGKARHWSIVLEGAATGTELVDSHVIDSQVAHWGGALAMLGQHSDIVGVQVVVETAPDPGVRLQAEVEQSRSDDVSPWADAVMEDIVATYPKSQSQISTKLAITFTNADRSSGRVQYRSAQEMETRIVNLLPALVSAVRASGAGGAARAISAQDIVDTIRVCFDPTVAQDVEQARRTGEGTGLRWQDAGPVRWDPHDEYVHHDRAFSLTHQMVAPPPVFLAQTLADLLRPHADVMRKRVALMYRPLGPMEAPRAVDRDVNDTKAEATKKNATARAEREFAIAKQVSHEEATGAGLAYFGLAVTGTTDDPAQLRRVDAALQHLAAPTRLRMRPALGNQASAFISTLPIGTVLPSQMVLPPEIHGQF